MNKFLIVLATVAHLIPHPFGASTVGATALYAGAYADRRIAWLVPLVPLFLANLLFGFYDFTVLAFVYGGFALSAVAAQVLLSRRRNLRRHAAAIVAGSVIFFLVSNFSVWLVGMYPPDLAGLVLCYVNGLPFLGISLASNAVYSAVLFGLHDLIERTEPEAVPA